MIWKLHHNPHWLWRHQIRNLLRDDDGSLPSTVHQAGHCGGQRVSVCVCVGGGGNNHTRLSTQRWCRQYPWNEDPSNLTVTTTPINYYLNPIYMLFIVNNTTHQSKPSKPSKQCWPSEAFTLDLLSNRTWDQSLNVISSLQLEDWCKGKPTTTCTSVSKTYNYIGYGLE